jgi:hypothetical protein
MNKDTTKSALRCDKTFDRSGVRIWESGCFRAPPFSFGAFNRIGFRAHWTIVAKRAG